jgi:RNA polymerase sigma-70 factor (ECF subfamily)
MSKSPRLTGTASPAAPDDLDRALVFGRSVFLGFLIKRLRNRADAEDVLQEFCLRVLSRKDQLRDAERLDAWLYAVLRSALNDHYRKAGQSRRLNDVVALEAKTAEITEDSAEALSFLCNCVKGLVSELRPADGDLIRRIDLEEADRTTVAADLGLRPGTLNVRLHRARAALSDALLSHCGYCCQHGFDDCSCRPVGCEHPVEKSDCTEHSHTD